MIYAVNQSNFNSNVIFPFQILFFFCLDLDGVSFDRHGSTMQ